VNIFINTLRNTVSMDTTIESCKHSENQTVAWELTHGFRGSAFMKSNNGALGYGDLYSDLSQL
jgi:hypothetical protein